MILRPVLAKTGIIFETSSKLSYPIKAAGVFSVNKTRFGLAWNHISPQRARSTDETVHTSSRDSCSHPNSGCSWHMRRLVGKFSKFQLKK